ncbi:MAG: nucleotide sugar dehydrogenase [Candidatus Hermodarchaeia archaeon]|jgi:GDP-mannose 6-dehydrogenase
MNKRISVFGLGYVGTISAACLAQEGHQVIGVDVTSRKVELINEGRSPVIERKINEIISREVESGSLRATTDGLESVINTDLSLVCVGTPSQENGSLDLTFVQRVCHEIGKAIEKKGAFHTVVLRSTVLPGTTHTIAIPALERSSGLVAGRDFGVSFNPEFLREGTSVEDFYNPPFTVIGAHDERGAAETASLFEGLDAPVLNVSIPTAEMVKYACNAFHAAKVVFANEIGNLCKSHGIDSHELMDIFCMDDKLNLSSYYLKPGFAFGGSCLPKDLRAMLYHGHRLDLQLPLLESILPSNRLQVERGIDMVIKTGRKKVGVLGFSFKAGTDDLRESPLVVLIETLLGKGYQITIYDKNVSLARLSGANKEFIEKEIPHVASLMRETVDSVLDESEVIVVGNNDPEFSHAISRVRPDQIIIDLVRLPQDDMETSTQYYGICW